MLLYALYMLMPLYENMLAINSCMHNMPTRQVKKK